MKDLLFAGLVFLVGMLLLVALVLSGEPVDLDEGRHDE